MTTILAAIDDSDAGAVVLATAAEFADVSNARPEALHVRENDSPLPRITAEAARMPLLERSGDVIDTITTAAGAPGVRAVVIGARRDPEGVRPAGHVAFALLTRLATPLVVVPPDAPSPARLRRMLIPLDGAMATALRAQTAIEFATSASIDLILIHVCDEERIPLFTDQPQYETRAFATEFLGRYAPDAPVQLELRVGSPAEEILEAVATLDADILAIAWSQILEPGRAVIVKQLLAVLSPCCCCRSLGRTGAAHPERDYSHAGIRHRRTLTVNQLTGPTPLELASRAPRTARRIDAMEPTHAAEPTRATRFAEKVGLVPVEDGAHLGRSAVRARSRRAAAAASVLCLGHV